MPRTKSWSESGLVIKGTLPDLNTEINEAKKHWSKYARHKKEWTTRVAWEAKSMSKIRSNNVVIEFNWYCKDRRKDKDNIAFAKKYILDGLVEAEILKNDSWQYIDSFYDLFYIDKNNPRVEIFIF